MPDPRLAIDHLPSLCDLRPKLLTLTALFRLWLINHFCHPDNIQLPSLKKCVWKNTPQTGIVIESATTWDPRVVMNRPSLVLKRGAWRRIKLGIGDKYLGVDATGQHYMCNWWQGAHTVFCLAAQDGEVELLATEVFQELNEFADAVRRRTGIKALAVGEIGETAILEESTQHFVVPVNLVYAVEESWILRQEAPFLKSLNMSMTFTGRGTEA